MDTMDEAIDYGIRQYTEEQKALHRGIIEVLKKEEHVPIPADDIMIVFGRIYSMFALSDLKRQGKIRKV